MFSTILSYQAKFITLLATVHEKNGDVQGATKSLDEAKQIRAKILKRVQVEQPDAVLEHRQLTAKICHQMAEQAFNQRYACTFPKSNVSPLAILI